MKALWGWLETTARALARAGGYLAAIALFVMAIGVTGDVLGRYLLGVSTQMAVEVSGYLLVAIVFLGLGYTQITNAHIKIELIINLLPTKIGQAIRLFNNIVFLIYCTVLGWLGFRAVWTSYRFGTTSRTSLDIIVWPIQLIIPIGLVIIVLVLLFAVFRPGSEPAARQPETLYD